MQNLSNYGVMELDTTEMREVEGGLMPLLVGGVALAILLYSSNAY